MAETEREAEWDESGRIRCLPLTTREFLDQPSVQTAIHAKIVDDDGWWLLTPEQAELLSMEVDFYGSGRLYESDMWIINRIRELLEEPDARTLPHPRSPSNGG